MPYKVKSGSSTGLLSLFRELWVDKSFCILELFLQLEDDLEPLIFLLPSER